MADNRAKVAHCINGILHIISSMLIFFVLALIWLYVKFISPLLGRSKCRFIPTCSDYARQAFKNFGVVAGLFLTVSRLLRCAPWSRAGYDPLPTEDELAKKHKILSFISNL